MNRTSSSAQEALGGDLERLMVGYQQADADALAELVSRLTPAMMSFFRGPHETRSYAEDLAQEFWLRVHKARHTYRPGSPVLPWIFSIARHTRVDMFRRLRYRQALASSQLEFDEALVMSDQSEESVLDSRLDSRALLARLPEKQREAIVLTKLKGLTVAEVARMTGTTVGAVKQRTFRALRNLQSMVSETKGGYSAALAKAV